MEKRYTWVKRPPFGRKFPATLAALACVAMAAPAPPAHANASVGHLATGGLVLSRTEAIEMASEDLFISMKEIRVTYRFFNRTDADVTTLVAFPLPDIRVPSQEDNFVIPEPDATQNFLAFDAEVDGKRIALQVEQRAEVLGVDQTVLLRSLNLPVSPYDAKLPGLLARLSEPARKQLRENGLIDDSNLTSGLPVEFRIRPLWTTRTTYYWTQTFPARKDITVALRYKPSVGGAAQSYIGEDYMSSESRRAYEQRYCIGESLVSTVRRARLRDKGRKLFFAEEWIEYILSTGANWAGPIGTFTLTVDKGSTGNLVSLCMDDMRKVGPTLYRAEKKDFRPRRNLDVLFLVPRRLP
ncbi:DUF4424 family protein [Zhengella mangrovi]|uniref:DUF4424 family protein n=1 Tax=Zhengella mangrovi TaxID=1982044 RepID=UPI0013FD1782|nr:DUF4424 family protein [Zhengella mangrovi]